MVGYLNFNSLRNKIVDLNVFLHDLQLEYLVVSFCDRKIQNQGKKGQSWAWRGLIEFVKRDIIY